MTNVGVVRSILSLVDYYKKFVEEFSTIVLLLIELKRKDVRFVWPQEHERSFQELTMRLVTALVLTISKGEGMFTIYNDAFGFGISCVLTKE